MMNDKANDKSRSDSKSKQKWSLLSRRAQPRPQPGGLVPMLMKATLAPAGSPASPGRDKHISVTWRAYTVPCSYLLSPLAFHNNMPSASQLRG